MRLYCFRWPTILISVATLGCALGCGGSPGDRPAPDAMTTGDAAMPPCDPAADDDGDCIANGIEGCQQTPPRDSDGDGSPDYVDGDADADKLPDEKEAATCDDPRDTDGDGVPDFQ